MLRLFLTLLVVLSSVLAQTTGTATLVGTITDNTGAIVPGQR